MPLRTKTYSLVYSSRPNVGSYGDSGMVSKGPSARSLGSKNYLLLIADRMDPTSMEPQAAINLEHAMEPPRSNSQEVAGVEN